MVLTDLSEKIAENYQITITIMSMIDVPKHATHKQRTNS